MKKCIWFILLMLGFFVTAHAQTDVAVYGHGNSTCADFVKFKAASNQQIMFNYQAWVNGYVSSHNLLHPHKGDVAKGKTPGELQEWLAHYCAMYPNRFFQRAVEDMTNDLE